MLRTRIAVFSLLFSVWIQGIAMGLLLAMAASGCQTLPEKPVVEVGAIDYPAGQVIAGLSDGSDPDRRVPLGAYDKATCFKPEAWEPWKAYVQLLEHYAHACDSAMGAR